MKTFMVQVISSLLCFALFLVALIANVTQAPDAALETLSTLRFADRMKQVQNEVHVRTDPYQSKLYSLAEENRKLRLINEQLRQQLELELAKQSPSQLPPPKSASPRAVATSLHIAELGLNREDDEEGGTHLSIMPRDLRFPPVDRKPEEEASQDVRLVDYGIEEQKCSCQLV
eukprot:m.257771 g.257771  ORF g.257771 m.257771 type:complete len:173 (+) comp15534_c7_seq1:257-775(+)